MSLERESKKSLKGGAVTLLKLLGQLKGSCHMENNHPSLGFGEGGRRQGRQSDWHSPKPCEC